MTTEGTRTFEVPVIVEVTVEVDPDGTCRIIAAGRDSEAGPWAFSGEQAAYEPAAADQPDGMDWTEQLCDDDEPARQAWLAAYDLPLIIEVPQMNTKAHAPTCPECEVSGMVAEDHAWICRACGYETSDPR